MAQLLKITKKSCLKVFRKFSPLKPVSAQKLEEEYEITSDQPDGVSRYDDLSTTLPQYPPKNENKDGILNVKETETVQTIGTTSTCEAYAQNSNSTNLEYNVFQSLTTRLFLNSTDGYEFQRLEQLRSDSVSEEMANEPELEPTVHDIVFEKVPYKKHVRYFRRTPSTLSLCDADDCEHNESKLTDYPFIDPPKRTQNAAVIKRNNNTDSGMRQTPIVQSMPQNAPSYVPMNVMNLEIKNPGKYESVVIAEQRDRFDKLMPVVKWDINGNSLDDDFYIDDSWNDSADINWNNASEKRVSQFKLDTESQKSSFRSSSTTLETWVDEDVLGSSFNERRLFATNLCRSKV
ncbi:uncharacterized protein LOC101455565 [Ceratitis capitata]|uniref:(Mediterranean fruit fly) hypothetical protein n=1 Tax=Ceratitis capitata TaxID=7213 RepID=A0A811UN73_CERCA|nr:uncharacterized protein LOC101455565 [Ceratitis capitata]CAD6998523.1 unnamed protein product [Ceratitis capitata]